MAGVSVFPSPLAACGNTNADSKPEKRKERTPVPLSLFLPGETAPAYSLQAEKSSPLVMEFAISSRLPGIVGCFSMHGIRGTKAIITWRLVMQ